MKQVLVLAVLAALALSVARGAPPVVARNEYQSLNPSSMPHGSFTRFIQLTLPSEVATMKNILGKIRLNGEQYRARCRCTDANHESSCRTPSRLRIHREAFNPGVGPKRTELAELLGKPSEFVLMPVKGASFSDVDSRESNLVLAAPGGDAGQFLIALQEYERVLGRELAFAQVEALFRSYVSQLEDQFYIATDEDSLAHLQRNLHVDGGTGDVLTLDLNDPDEELKAELLKDLVKPRNQGSRFLRAVLEAPEAFMMRRALVRHFVRAVYRTMWDRSTSELQQLSNRIKLTVFDGRPRPVLWMNMIGNAHCQQEHKAPAFSPRSRRGVGEVQVLVNHPFAVSTLRHQMARHFVGVAGGELQATVGELHARFDRAGARALEIFAEKVCKKLAVYTVTVE